jgi:hypothetical protein
VHRPVLPRLHGFEHADGRDPLDGAALRLRRTIVDHLGLAAACPRPHCRGAGACRGRDVPCFDTRRPAVVAGMEAILYEGYVVADDWDDDP